MSDQDIATIRHQLVAAHETIRQQQRSLEKFVLERLEPIAIIGVGLRFPGGNDTLDGFDAFLRAGGSGIRPLPRERWDTDSFAADATAPGAISTVAGGFLDRIDEFDAQFFNISPKQAPYLDPQQRILLETAWEALENANLDPTPLRHGTGGIYIGASPLDFALELDSLAAEQLDGTLATGMGGYSLSGRLSYFLGWRGPSLTTDTACASSLTALHLAVEGLRRHECDVALCGAVNALHNPRSFVILSQGRMLAPDGRCKTFDEAADGYARAEGCGVLVLKRLSDAWQDGDNVLAIVRGTAIGQDGESAGLTAPNGTAQEAVMRAALAGSRLEPADIQYVEAHGTGTPLGDPIELGSINGVFGAAHRTAPLTVGSLKSNIGHMEPAAGVGAIIKVVLQLRGGVFYPSLLSTPSGRIPWDTYPVTVPDTCRRWEAPVRRATVNGFGVAGAIGVAVLEQAPPPSRQPAHQPEPAGQRDGAHVFTLSAKSEPALRQLLARYRDFLAEHQDVDLADLCYTTNVGRAHFRHRVAGVARSTGALTELLGRAPAGPGAHRDQVRKVAFLFTGSGSQYAGMGTALYHRFPSFRDTVDRCDELFEVHLGRSIADIMLGRAPDAEAALTQTRHAHAALFTLEYALAMLWRSWGVRPSVLIGHSVGELVAATVAGVFSLPDGVTFLAERARLIESIPVPGGMAAVTAPVTDVAPLLTRWSDLAVAAINSPHQCVISGAADSLDSAVELLRGRGLTVTPLRVSAGFHSPLVEQISERLGKVLAEISFNEPELTIISNLTGQPVAPEMIMTPEYWVRHVNEPVDFASGIAAIGERGRHVFLEIGPSTALTSLARQCLPHDQHKWLACLHRKDTTATTIHNALAGLYTAGLTPSWSDVHSGQTRRKIGLPGYAFDRRRYWLPRGNRGGEGAGHPLLGRQVGELEYASRISAARPAYLADHASGGRAFLPAAAAVETLLALADARHGTTAGPLKDIRFHQPLFLTDALTWLYTRARRDTEGRLLVELVSRPDDSSIGNAIERRHVTATLCGPDTAGLGPAGRDLLRRLDNLTEPDQTLTAEEIYAAYARVGLTYGPRFSRARSVARYGADLTVTELSGSDISPAEYLPPPVLDGATHGLAALADDGQTYLATRIAEVRMFKKPRAANLRAIQRLTRPADPAGPAFTIDVLLLEDTTPVMELTGMAFTHLPRRPAPEHRPATTGGASRTGDGTSRLDPSALRAATPSARRTAIAELIRHVVADLLSIDEVDRVDPGASFLELGVDSLVAIDLKNALESRLRMSFPASAVFDQPSVELLAEYLARSDA